MYKRQVHTPIITASDCEGAGEMFQVTTLDLENVPRNEDGTVDYTQDFFGKRANLTVSGQLNCCLLYTSIVALSLGAAAMVCAVIAYWDALVELCGHAKGKLQRTACASEYDDYEE